MFLTEERVLSAEEKEQGCFSGGMGLQRSKRECQIPKKRGNGAVILR